MYKKFLVLLLLYASYGMCAPTNRAPRPDALSYPGSTPQIVSPFDSALLAGIKKCICELKNQSEECCASIGSHLDEIDTRLEIIQITLEGISGLERISSLIPELVSAIDNITIGSLGSQIAIIESLLEGQQCCSIVGKISTQLDVVESLVQDVVQQGCGSSTAIVVSSIDTLTTLIENTSSVVDKISTQIDTLESFIENQVNCCSQISVIAADLSLLPVINSKADAILFDVGSRSDFAFSNTDQLSTIEQIDALDISVIAWLKTILADLHGL